jgi:hypothetical protein
MICTNWTDEISNEEIPNFVSIALNLLTVVVFVSLIFYKPYKSNSVQKIIAVRWDSLISVLLIFNGLTEVFSILESSLNFCRFSPHYVDCVLTCLNVILIVPTFYVVCVFRCQTLRHFIVCDVSIASYYFSFAILRFYELSKNLSPNSNVEFTLLIFSSICNGALCLLFIANLANISSRRFSLQQNDVI